MECKYKAICIYLERGNCQAELCKFVKDSPVVKEKKGRRKKAKSRVAGTGELSVEHDADVLIARRELKKRQKKGKLTDEQSQALNKLNGKWVKHLNEPERQQILDILRESE